MKVINFLTGNFMPENCAGTNRILSLVKALEKRYKVNIFCITEKGKPQKNQRIKYSDNVDVYYIDQRDYNGEKFYTRALHEFYYAIRLALKSNKFNCDITIATSPQMFIIPSVAIFGKGKRVIDVRDLVWEYIEENSLYKTLMKKVLTNFMQVTLKVYDHITVTNDHEYYWIKDNIREDGITKISNGIELGVFNQLKELNIDKNKKFTVTYIGNVGIAQNIKTLVDVAKTLKDIKVNIIGTGNRYNQLKEYVHKNRIFNVEFFGRVQRDKMIDFYQESSVLFAQLDETFKAAMPSKLYEYASTGLPIIYAGIGIAKEFVDNLDNCVTINPGDVKALESAIKRYKDVELKISHKNRDIIKENFIREFQSEKMVDVVESLILKEK